LHPRPCTESKVTVRIKSARSSPRECAQHRLEGILAQAGVLSEGMFEEAAALSSG